MDERKLKILNSIIKSYTESKEPVGSRTLSKKENIGVSAATIRNEMSDLEDLGYLVKVHSSSGRVPSDRGYRLYVNALLSDKVPFRLPRNELFDTSSLDQSHEFDSIMSNATKILSAITNYTAMAIMPESNDLVLKYINVVMLSPKDLVIFYIYSSKSVKHEVIRLHSPINMDNVNLINSIMNAALINLSPKEILQKLDSNMFRVLRSQNSYLDFLLPHIEAQVEKMARDYIIYEGLGNIYRYNDLDLEQNRALIDFIQNEDPLLEIINKKGQEDLKILIGEEIGLEEFKDFSIISMTFRNKKGLEGKLAVIGPMAMEYDKVISDLLIVIRYINGSI
ncbi:MAG: heat-inducible transcriptional repressor HrcA [Tissierellia bacterium]|nr:heat-inducible transcriptional repressor HrcA [Tissierellia bacterium]